MLKKTKEFFCIFFWCLNFSWNASKLYTIIRILGEIITPLLFILSAYWGKIILDILSSLNRNNELLNKIIILMIILFLTSAFRTILNKILEYIQFVHDNMILNNISMTFIEKALTVDLEYFDNPSYYDKLTATMRDSNAVINILWNTLKCISSIVTCLSVFFLLSRVNIFYCLITVVAAIPTTIIAANYTKLLYKLSISQVNSQRQMGYYQTMATSKEYAQEIRLFDSKDKIIYRYKKIWEKLFVEKRKIIGKRTFLFSLLMCLPEIVTSVVGIDITINVFKGKSTVGDYSLYTGLISQLWMSISTVIDSVMRIYENRMQIEYIKSLDDFISHICDNGTKDLNTISKIEFRNVTFIYPNTDKPAINNISFTLNKNQKTAIVGLNGSGKTTLIKLILRMYDPTDGMILINDCNIKNYSLSKLRRNFSVYFQDMVNYKLSIKDNFIFVDDNVYNEKQEIEKALKNCQCEDILQNAFDSLETSISKMFDLNGIELSGGQHQKFAIARSLYRCNTALILDEPSSNIDPEAEHKIFETLNELTCDKLVIFTSHRLSNISLADRIIVMENGSIIEDGTQNELLNYKSRYFELFNYQREKYQII